MTCRIIVIGTARTLPAQLEAIRKLGIVPNVRVMKRIARRPPPVAAALGSGEAIHVAVADDPLPFRPAPSAAGVRAPWWVL